MPVIRSFGRVTRAEPLLAVAAVEIASDEAMKREGCVIRVLAFGNSHDYNDWITVAFSSGDPAVEARCLEAFSKRITRLGAVLMTSGE